MADSIPFDTLKSFYEAAREILEIAPWDFMEEDEIFAVRPAPEGEVFFVCVTGAAGISRSLIFYRGERGWDTYLRLQSGGIPPDEAIQMLDTLNLDFEPRGNLDPESRKRLKRAGWRHDGDFHPAPVVYRPGKQPRPPDSRELELLTSLARLIQPVLRKSDEEPGWLLEGPGDDSIYHVRPGSAPDHCEGEWLPPPGLIEEAFETVPADQFASARLKRKPLHPCAPWEIRIGTSGAAVGGPGEAWFPLAALFVDASSGFVAGFSLAPAGDMPKELPNKIASAMESHGARPEAFHVDRDDAAAWIHPFADSLGVPVLRKKRLPQADMAFQAMKDMLRAGSSGKLSR